MILHALQNEIASVRSMAYIGRFPVDAICLMMRIQKDFTNMSTP